MSAFVKQHYDALAKVLGSTRPGFSDVYDGPKKDQWEADVREITKMLVLDNPGFSIERFLKAVKAHHTED